MRLHLLAVAALLGLTAPACKCGGGGDPDGGKDGGADAGPMRCETTADCAAAGANLVCDPQDKICIPKCTDDGQCSHVSSGVCEKTDGTCRAPCGPPNEDYCPTVSMELVCRADTGRCVKRCHQDDDCSAIKPGTRCTEATGQCTDDAHGCSFDTDCNGFVEFDDYCFNGGIQCRCVLESNDAGFPGICHRRNLPCTECTNNAQCGEAPQFNPQGACLVVPGDMSGKKYCLFQHSGPCACGYFDNGNGYCAPAQGRTCADPGCAADKDCPGGSVCNTQRCACEPRCRWDFATKTTSAPGCPPNQTCWVDNENLDPASIYYGSGRCKPPCGSDVDCAFNSTTNPHGGTKLKCAAEQLSGGGLSDKRCRANGDCMDDLECPVQPDTSIYFGYCDRGSFQCKLDCRLGTDPVTGKPYNDCRAPYGCKLENGMNKCVLKTCVEQGGAAIACNIGQYCCGEDKNSNDAGDPCPSQNDRDLSGCYRAPSPPFCKACRIFCPGDGSPCMVQQDCNTGLPSWLTTGPDHCTNGSNAPSCAQWPNGKAMPNICNIYDNAQDMATGDVQYYGYCEAATHNDIRRNNIGRSIAAQGCPATFGVRFDPVGVQGLPIQTQPFLTMMDNFCDTDADCRKGNDAGTCGPSAGVPKRMDGSLRKACLCTVGSAVNQCPNQADAGLTSFCRDGIPGETQFCVADVVCQGPGAYLFGDPDAGPLYGCGVTPPPP